MSDLRRAGKRRAKAEAERGEAHRALCVAVKQAHAEGMKPSQIAEQAQVSRQTIHNILRG